MNNLPIAPFGEVQVSVKSLLRYCSFHYNINTELVNVSETSGGTVTQSGSAAVLQTGTNAAGAARLSSRIPARYISGQGLMIVFSAIFPANADIAEAGFGNLSDGFLFNVRSGIFGINRRSSVTGAIIDSPAQVIVGGHNASKYNVYGVSFQWLGAGEINYWIENKGTGVLEKAHTIQYANENEVLSLLNPSLPLWARIGNAGGTSNQTLKIGNMAAYVFGQREMPGLRQSERASLAYTTGAERVVIAIENMTDVFGGTGNNRSIVLPDFLSWSTEGVKPVTLRVKRCTITGGTSAAVNANTSLARKYTGTPTISNAKLLFPIEAAKADNGFMSAANFPDDVELAPGEALVVTAESTAINDVSVSVGWKDLL